MISVDAVRTAVESDLPWTRLDELVRAEMAAGRKVKEIAADFHAVLDEVRDTPGLTDDGDDALLDTLDALTGRCKSDQCYRDPPRTDLPSEEEIASLPRWARVAFAARCTHRVLPLLTLADPRVATRHAWRLARGVQELEMSAASCGSSTIHDVTTPQDIVELIQADFTATHVLKAIEAGVLGAKLRSVEFFKEAAWDAACAVSRIVPRSAPIVRLDFDALALLVVRHGWTDETPVSIDVFGPLWPEGPPKGWPPDPNLLQRVDLPVVFLAVEKAGPDVVVNEAVNVFNALNRYYIARTGHRLTLEGDIYTLLSALVGAGV